MSAWPKLCCRLHSTMPINESYISYIRSGISFSSLTNSEPLDGGRKGVVEHTKSELPNKAKKEKEAPLGFLGVAPCNPPAWPLRCTTSWQWPHWLQALARPFGGFGSTFSSKFPDLGHLQSLWERRSLIQTGDSVALTTTGQFTLAKFGASGERSCTDEEMDLNVQAS